jgi:hypothetical protein
MKTSPLRTKFSVLGSITFANARTSAIRRMRKQEPSQMQLAFERARAKAQ